MALLYRQHLAQPDPDPLQRFDLSESEVLEDIIRRALNDAEGAHPLSPPGTAGQRMHQATVAYLRELLIPRKWKIDQTDGVARTVAVERCIAIIAAAGNEFTGLPGTDDRFTTKWPKGSCALNSVRYVAEGFDSIDSSFPSSPKVEGCWDIWYLIHRIVDGEVRVEISNPSYLDKRDYPSGWRERIILNPLQLNPEVDIYPDTDEPDDGPEVPVLPK
ncbi:hypothetical protein [Nocardia anaemiae]|uniref:hypothetical protein n=1 Tax=Nocardia anaemiae TaxID=263910 RepID=UPI0012F4EFA5|nr:hypothetical protein [Nocardia anaemiae]